MSHADVYQITIFVAQLLEKLGVAYEIGGSLASSLHGVPRSTLDADIVADLTPQTALAFTRELGDEYYQNAEAIVRAVREKRSFNIIHLATMLKIDVFALKDSAFSRAEFARRVRTPFPNATGPLVWVSSPEDIILHKLCWYEAGDKAAQRQYADAVGVLRVASAKLDAAHLARWAETLGVKQLLEQAMLDAQKQV
jgi:hypothetical protein